jgi:hypothetical protein
MIGESCRQIRQRRQMGAEGFVNDDAEKQSHK